MLILLLVIQGLHYVEAGMRNHVVRQEIRELSTDFIAIYNEVLQNNTVPDAVSYMLSKYSLPCDVVIMMWNDVIVYAKVTAPENWSITLEIYHEILQAEFCESPALASFAENIYLQIEDHQSNLTSLHTLAANISGELAKLKQHSLSDIFLSNFMKFYYQENLEAQSYSDTNINYQSIVIEKSEVTEVNITVASSITALINTSLSEITKVLILISVYSSLETVQMLAINQFNLTSIEEINSQTTLHVNFANNLSSSLLSCEVSVNNTWSDSFCSVQSNSEIIQITSSQFGLFRINSKCPTSFTPKAIAITLIVSAFLFTIILLVIERVTFNRELSLTAIIQKNDPKPVKTEYEAPTMRNVSQSVYPENSSFFTSKLVDYHLILSIFSKDYFKAVRNLLIYLNSLLVQIGLTVIFYRKEALQGNLWLNGIVSATIAGAISYVIFAFPVYRKMLSYLLYAAWLGFGIFSAVNVFKDIGICGNWVFAYIASVMLDAFVLQTFLMLIAGLCNLNIKKSH